MGGPRWKNPLCAVLLVLAAGVELVLPLSNDAVQDLSDIGIDSPRSSFSKDALDDVVVEGAISLSRVRRAGSLAGGTPGQDFPVLNAIPRTSFDCRSKGHGYYADVDTGCQVFHVCHADGRMNSFLCPNTTVFNQRRLVCDWWYNVDCRISSQHFSVNEEIGKVTPSPDRPGVSTGFSRATPSVRPATPSPVLRGSSGFTTIQQNFGGRTEQSRGSQGPVSRPLSISPPRSPPSFASRPRSSSPPALPSPSLSPRPSPSPSPRPSPPPSPRPPPTPPRRPSSTPPGRLSQTSPRRPFSTSRLPSPSPTPLPPQPAAPRPSQPAAPRPSQPAAPRPSQSSSSPPSPSPFSGQSLPTTFRPGSSARKAAKVSVSRRPVLPTLAPARPFNRPPAGGVNLLLSGIQSSQTPANVADARQTGQGVPLPTLTGNRVSPSTSTRGRGTQTSTSTGGSQGFQTIPSQRPQFSPPTRAPQGGSRRVSEVNVGQPAGTRAPSTFGNRIPQSPTKLQSGGVPLPTLSGRGSLGTSVSQSFGTQPQRPQVGQPVRIPGAVSPTTRQGARGGEQSRGGSVGVPLPGLSSSGGSDGGRGGQGRGSGGFGVPLPSIAPPQAGGGGVPLPGLSSSRGTQGSTFGVSLPSPRPTLSSTGGGSNGVRLPSLPSGGGGGGGVRLPSLPSGGGGGGGVRLPSLPSRGSGGFGSARPATVQGTRGPILIIEADRDDLDDRFDDDRFDLDDRFDDDRFDDDRFDDDRFDDDRFDLDDRFDDDRFDLDDRFDDDRFDLDDRFDDDRFDLDDRFDDDRFDLDDRFDDDRFDLDDRFDDDRFDDDHLTTVRLPPGANIPSRKVVILPPPSEVQLPPPIRF